MRWKPKCKLYIVSLSIHDYASRNWFMFGVVDKNIYVFADMDSEGRFKLENIIFDTDRAILDMREVRYENEHFLKYEDFTDAVAVEIWKDKKGSGQHNEN